MEPTFTIIIATFNCGNLIGRCLESVYNQVVPVEVWVIDNCSTDQTAQVVSSYSTRGAKILIEKDRGVFDAWNKGLERAKGEWIIFMGADDYFKSKDSLCELSSFISKGDFSSKIIYGSVTVENSRGQTIRTVNQDWEMIQDRLCVTLPFTHVGTAHHFSLFEGVKRFDETFRIAGDYEFLFSELLTRGAVYAANYKISMQIGGLSTSAKNRLRLIKEVERVWKRNDVRIELKVRAWISIKKVVFRLVNKIAKNVAL